MMTYKQIETSREIRLWITSILGPIIMGAATILANNPELRVDLWLKTKQKMRSLKQKMTFKKKTKEEGAS